MKNQTKKNKGFTLVELLIVLAIVGILSFNAVVAYSKFVKEAMISEGKMLASSIVKIERLYHAESNNYYEILNSSYSEVPEIDSRFNKYFKTFSVHVPGNVADSIFTVVTTSEQNVLAGVEVVIHAFENKSSIMTVTYTGLTGGEPQAETTTDTDTQGSVNTDNNNSTDDNGNNGHGNTNDGDDNNNGGGQEKNGNNGKK
ncbi:MAG: prepilin-type N-terminal cleavage/methylation domain-containing protein [Endomicrobiaceae bacterium]|nr:prepilin-type N-terminal cleavage/methylation domain-containing protein [Endomicrobiaceae bacterium]